MQNHQNASVTQQQLAIEEASYWIDQGNPDQAIQVLEPWFNDQEMSVEQNQVRIVLASAYVHRSGIKMSRFVEFLKNLRNLSSDQSKVFQLMDEQLNFLVSINPSWREAESTKKYIFKFYRFLFLTSQIVKLAYSLPAPLSGGASDLEAAIDLISDDNEWMTTGNFLFRSALRLFLINYKIKNKKYFSAIHQCPLKLLPLERDLIQVRNAILDVLTDLSKALPRQKNSLDPLIDTVSKADLKDAIKKMDPETFEYFLKAVEWIEEESCS